MMVLARCAQLYRNYRPCINHRLIFDVVSHLAVVRAAARGRHGGGAQEQVRHAAARVAQTAHCAVY